MTIFVGVCIGFLAGGLSVLAAVFYALNHPGHTRDLIDLWWAETPERWESLRQRLIADQSSST